MKKLIIGILGIILIGLPAVSATWMYTRNNTEGYERHIDITYVQYDIKYDTIFYAELLVDKAKGNAFMFDMSVDCTNGVTTVVQRKANNMPVEGKPQKIHINAFEKGMCVTAKYATKTTR